MSRKRILLFLALILPLLVFLFLKFFGKNEFAIPVFYADAIDSVNTSCGTHYTLPYRIPDSVLKQIDWQGLPATLYVVHNSSDVGVTANRDRELKRVVENVAGTIQVASDEDAVRLADPTAHVSSRVQRWQTCVFLFPIGKNVVLIDQEQRIRGYYSIESREEADRLILELEILLKKY